MTSSTKYIAFMGWQDFKEDNFEQVEDSGSIVKGLASLVLDKAKEGADFKDMTKIIILVLASDYWSTTAPV